jgi:hypothetical protein
MKKDKLLFEKNKKAFEDSKEKLMKTHYNLYVAFVNGELADSDTDEKRLYLRVLDKYGYIPIYLHKVTEIEEIRYVR